MSFSKLKSKSADISKLISAAESSERKQGGADERYWKPEVDKSGNGYAVIRFLPAPDGEDLPWVKYWSHGFKGPTGQWYIENSLTSINQPDPLSELNSQLWNSGRDEDKERVRAQKRRLHYVSNIMVVKDPANPANEGKIFMYQYGKKIFDKLMDVMQPQFADEDPINPFDFWEGADFKLKIRQVEGYRNYDKSEFDSPTPLMGGDDDQLEAVYNKQYSLKELVDPSNYKTYEELKARLNKVLGDTGAHFSTAEQVALDSAEDYNQSFGSAPGVAAEPATAAEPEVASSESEDDTLSYFAKLANS